MMIHVCFRSTKATKDQPTSSVVQLTFSFLEELKAEEQLVRETLPRARRKTSAKKKARS